MVANDENKWTEKSVALGLLEMQIVNVVMDVQAVQGVFVHLRVLWEAVENASRQY